MLNVALNNISAILLWSVLFVEETEYPNKTTTDLMQVMCSCISINRNYSSILDTLQITSYALGAYIALLFTLQLDESLIKLYFKQFSIFQLKF